ncbi:MAG: hypothetical protein R6X02_18020 [Enhygromyxa sp.]
MRLDPRILATMMLATAWPSPARAGNEAHVRTPVLWPSQCAVIVDRSVEPLVHFDYTIPLEDTELTPEELPDSRTHQFVALCRERPLSELLPSWITRDDLDRSAAAGLVPTADQPAEAILDESPAWSGCFARITDDDDRRPITFAQAALGVDWDTREAALGVWTVAGYTFEPPLNLWRERPGFVKIVDDRADPEQDLPAIALLGDERVVEPGELVELEACVDVLEPATILLEWAEFAPELEWRPLSTSTVESDGPLRLELTVPSAAAERELLVRARLRDARERERLAYLPARLSVLPCPTTGCVDPPPEPDPPPDAEAPRAGCRSASVASPALLGLLLLPLARRRRRSAT